MIKKLMLAASAIGGVVTLGRSLADKSIEKRLPSVIEQAKALAIEELDREIDTKVTSHLTEYSLTILIKAGMVSVFFILFSLGIIEPSFFKVSIVVLLAAFLGHDLTRMLPHIPIAAEAFRQYGFNVKRAITEHISATAFERAYGEALAQLENKKTKRVVAVSNYSIEGISEEVASAVAEVAQEIGFERLKPRVVSAALKVGSMMLLYAGFLALVIWS